MTSPILPLSSDVDTLSHMTSQYWSCRTYLILSNMDTKSRSLLVLFNPYYPCVRMGTVLRSWTFLMWMAMFSLHQNAQSDWETAHCPTPNKPLSQHYFHSNVTWQTRMLPKDQPGRKPKEWLLPRQEGLRHTLLVAPYHKEQLQLTGSTFQGQTSVFCNTLGDFLTSRTRSNSNDTNPSLFPKSNFFLHHIKYLKKVEIQSEHW